MAVYQIDSFNYMTAGKTEKLLNVDISLPVRSVHIGLLGHHADGSAGYAHNVMIRTEHGYVLFKVPTKQQQYDEEYNKHTTLKNQFLVADISQDTEETSFGGSANRFSFAVPSTGDAAVVHSLYNLNDICIKSSIKKIRNPDAESAIKNTDEDYIDIYTPDMDDSIIAATQLDKYAYCLSKRTNQGPYTLQTDLVTQRELSAPSTIRDTQYHWYIRDYSLPTYIYNTSADIDGSNVLSDYYKPRANLSGVQYNYVFEIPQNLPELVFNDYAHGDIQGDIFQAKNVYDYTYGMNMSSDSQLNMCRDYVGIDTCGDVAFLKFIDNVTYTFDNIGTKESKDPDEVIQVPVKELSANTYPFQKIETLDSINRFRSNVRHKSTLFSIGLLNTGINQLPDVYNEAEATTDEKLAEQ